MLEHVPEPDAVIAACTTLIRDDGRIFLSTINRNPKAWLFAVIGAEYLLNMLPRGTHEYSKFIRPSEMEAWARHSGLQLTDLTGMSYNPLTREYSLGTDVSVNYLATFQKI
jgi:2-polyprenyl-6-hydroxyphenyl methylase/3-demethylubiquinone-9 3-methyltransferase